LCCYIKENKSNFSSFLEAYPSGQAGSPVVNGVELQKSHADPSENRVQETPISQDPTIKSVLQLGIICLPGMPANQFLIMNSCGGVVKAPGYD